MSMPKTHVQPFIDYINQGLIKANPTRLHPSHLASNQRQAYILTYLASNQRQACILMYRLPTCDQAHILCSWGNQAYT